MFQEEEHANNFMDATMVEPKDSISDQIIQYMNENIYGNTQDMIDKIIYNEIINNLDNYNLTEKEKNAFKLYYFDDLSIKEIANKLNNTESNIKYYLYSARNKIKENYYE